jgi:hypothetical protein
MNVVDQLVADLDAISDRAELVAFLAPLRAPNDLPDSERARLTEAVRRPKLFKERFDFYRSHGYSDAEIARAMAASPHLIDRLGKQNGR